jgi:hypothetical protein
MLMRSQSVRFIIKSQKTGQLTINGVLTPLPKDDIICKSLSNEMYSTWHNIWYIYVLFDIFAN